jgi:hypothetical protein
MCSLDVQQTVCGNNMCFRCAAKLAAYLRNATTALHAGLHPALHVVLHAALHAFLTSFYFSNLFLDLSTQKRMQHCMQRDVAFVQRDVALHGLLHSV